MNSTKSSLTNADSSERDKCADSRVSVLLELRSAGEDWLYWWGWFRTWPFANVQRNTETDFAVHRAQHDGWFLVHHVSVPVVLKDYATWEFLELPELFQPSFYALNDFWVRVKLGESPWRIRVGVLHVEQVRVAAKRKGVVRSLFLARMFFFKHKRIAHRVQIGFKSLFAFGPILVRHNAHRLHEYARIEPRKGRVSMAPRRQQPQETLADLLPEKAYTLLSAQLEKLQALKAKNYQEAEAAEEEWFQFTHRLVLRSFGSASSHYRNFGYGKSAGEHYMRPAFSFNGYESGVDHRLNQSNFLARLQAYENVLKSSLAELKIDLPEPEIKGVYEPGQEYEFYKGIKTILGLAAKELFVVDPYLNKEIFETYADTIPRTVKLRLLSTNIPLDVVTLGKKYASGGNFQFRSSNAMHDRVIFVDQRAWVCGQSLKDAAKKKPTYIVEIEDADLMRPAYENIWNSASVIV